MNVSERLGGTNGTVTQEYTPVTRYKFLNVESQLALLSSRPFFTLLRDAKLKLIQSNIDVSGTMNISKSNLFPILPSTIRDSRYQSLVR
jgi:hypothetical protein